MENERVIAATGGILSAILAAATGAWQIILIVFLLYAITLFGNLLTGLLYARQTKTYSKDKAHESVNKKLAMVIGIAVLALIDIILIGLASQAGIKYTVPILTCILAGYAAVHEFISMLTNIQKLGNKVPTAIKNIAEKAGESLNQGKIPDLSTMVGKKDLNENNP